VGDGEWSQPTEQQYIRFTNLESGTHELYLRSVSRTCNATLDEQKLTIVIGQPWWNSWWMWIVYICLIGLAFYGAWKVYELHTKYMRLVINNPNINANTDKRWTHEDEEIEQQDSEGTEFIDEVTKIVASNLSDSEFNIDQLCREMAMSRTHFYLKLKSYTGKSPQDFIRVIRLERAAALLRGGHPVTETAVLAGFDNPKYFRTVFKKYFGVSPSKYC
jgi:AraC-like DNA-binding protein